MSQNLRVRWRGGDRTFDTGTTVTLGRDPAVTIRLDDERVSRRHAELRFDGQTWRLVDLGSTSGTYLADQRITELALRAPTTVRFGGRSSSEDVQFELVAGASAPLPPPTQIAGPLALDATVVPGDVGARRPGGALAPGAAAGRTEITDDTLQVQLGAQTRTLHPGERIVVGRDHDADLHTDNPTVSRRHVALSYVNGGWVAEDLGSARGTFADGRKIDRMAIRGSVALLLGPPDSGERLVLVAAGVNSPGLVGRARRSRNLGLIAAGTCVIAALVAVGIVVLNRGDDGAAAKHDVSNLRAATVKIDAGSATGSGSIIDGQRGLILTNAHVARPDAPGLGVQYSKTIDELRTSPRDVVVMISSDADAPAEPKFRGRVVASDGYLDLAVVKITETYNGRIVGDDEDLELPEVPIGDSTTIDHDDPIVVVGFPGVADSDAPQITNGAVSGFIADPRLHDNRAFINSDVAIAGGNSGGLAADDQGRLIGVPTSELSDRTGSFSRLRPIHLAADLIAAAKAGDDYTSPFVVPASAEAVDVDSLKHAVRGQAAFSPNCRNRTSDGLSSLSTMSFTIDYSGFPNGHQDVLVQVFDATTNERIGRASTADDYPIEFTGTGCLAVSIPIVDADGRPSAMERGQTIALTIDVGPNYELNVFRDLDAGAFVTTL